MRKPVRQFFYTGAKALGLFKLAAYLTRHDLRILCYHGGALQDETEWRPSNFIRSETFRHRLQYIKEYGYRVISLDEARAYQKLGRFPPKALVITIDDGFYSTYLQMVPLLVEHQMPATFYITTYYVEKQTPIFRLGVQYLHWLAKSGASKEEIWKYISRGENQCTEEQRTKLLEELAAKFGVDWNAILASRKISFVTKDEIRHMAKDGIDIQLHTHRHRLPESESEVACEITDNRAVLEPLVGRKLVHFCYPSGIYSKHHQAPLLAQNIETATTSNIGLNRPETNPLLLNRILDSEFESQLDFEAEVSGFRELFRRLKARSFFKTGNAHE